MLRVLDGCASTWGLHLVSANLNALDRSGGGYFVSSISHCSKLLKARREISAVNLYGSRKSEVNNSFESARLATGNKPGKTKANVGLTEPGGRARVLL